MGDGRRPARQHGRGRIQACVLRPHLPEIYLRRFRRTSTLALQQIEAYADTRKTQDEYRGDNIFWVPKEARWEHIQNQAKQPTIGRLIDDAMSGIERDNKALKGVLPKDYARPGPRRPTSGSADRRHQQYSNGR